MIERYENKRIKQIWSKSYRYDLWEKISLKYLNNKMNRDNIYPTARYNEVIERYEQKTKHEFVAFLTHLHERLEYFKDPEILQNLHYGLTSSDIIDTAFNLQLRHSYGEVYSCLHHLQRSVTNVLKRLNDVKCIGRTHGKHAEEMNFNSRFLTITKFLIIKLCSIWYFFCFTLVVLDQVILHVLGLNSSLTSFLKQRNNHNFLVLHIYILLFNIFIIIHIGQIQTIIYLSFSPIVLSIFIFLLCMKYHSYIREFKLLR